MKAKRHHTKMNLRIYRDKKGDFRWSLSAVNNGKEVSDSAGDGYKRRRDMERGLFLNFLGDQFYMGKHPVLCVLEFRKDFTLIDETVKTARKR